MKYMTFEGSSKFAGVANLLEDYQIDIEVDQLIREMKVGYIFKYDLKNDRYISGPMLQDKKYIDYYLNPLGLELIEKTIAREDFIDFLRNFKRRCILEVGAHNERHTIIFEEYNLAREKFIFLNNRHENSKEKYFFDYSQDELLKLLDEELKFSYISYKKGDYIVDLDRDIYESKNILSRYYRDIKEYIEEPRSENEPETSMDSLFRPFLFDLYKVIDVIDHGRLGKMIKDLQESYLRTKDLNGELKLKNYIDLTKFREAIEEYQKIIDSELKTR